MLFTFTATTVFDCFTEYAGGKRQRTGSVAHYFLYQPRYLITHRWWSMIIFAVQFRRLPVPFTGPSAIWRVEGTLPALIPPLRSSLYSNQIMISYFSVWRGLFPRNLTYGGMYTYFVLLNGNNVGNNMIIEVTDIKETQWLFIVKGIQL